MRSQIWTNCFYPPDAGDQVCDEHEGRGKVDGGNWDVKTKIPEQCQVSGIKLPPYFMEWINVKDVYLNFYNHRAAGMMAMLKGLSMPIIGSHHVGIDDAQNITRILQRMLVDGALMQITARRTGMGSSGVKFMFKNRI